MIRLVAIDDDIRELELLATVLQRDGVEVSTFSDPVAGLEEVLRNRPDVVILDLIMPGLGGMEILQRIVEQDPTVEVIVLTGCDSTKTAVEAVQKGAADYLLKPISLDQLSERIDRLIELGRQRQQTLRLDRELLNSFHFEGMVGRSPSMLDVFARIRRVAPHFRTLLVTGPTGSGKELVARALHKLSPVHSSRFVTCNCSAIVDSLSESELFGHVAGAFTGAVRDKVGLFEYANGGTLFLDEIGEMPLGMQARLLRVLQTQEIQRVGSPATHKLNVRVIAATHRDVPKMVSQKLFREDLYYRLSVFEIQLPRLSERKEDLPLLERYFLERLAGQYHKEIRGLTRRAQAVLARYPWPGNIRELENALGNACLTARGEVIDVLDLPDRLRTALSSPGDEVFITLEEAQHRHVLRVLQAVGGNRAQAAQVLGVSRATFYRLLNRSHANSEALPVAAGQS